MNEIQASCSLEQALELESVGAVQATVNGRLAIVTANAGVPITREILDLQTDIAAQGTLEADQETQALIDSLDWEEWQ